MAKKIKTNLNECSYCGEDTALAKHLYTDKEGKLVSEYCMVCKKDYKHIHDISSRQLKLMLGIKQ